MELGIENKSEKDSGQKGMERLEFQVDGTIEARRVRVRVKRDTKFKNNNN